MCARGGRPLLPWESGSTVRSVMEMSAMQLMHSRAHLHDTEAAVFDADERTNKQQIRDIPYLSSLLHYRGRFSPTHGFGTYVFLRPHACCVSVVLCVTFIPYVLCPYWLTTKTIAIANRSRVSCAHDTSRASNNTMTLKSRLQVNNVIETDAIRKLGCGFLSLCSNYGDLVSFARYS